MPEEQPKKKKGPSFGQRVKGVGAAIGRQAKKVPGVVYREAIKPELERIREKFTEEVTPAPPKERIGTMEHVPFGREMPTPRRVGLRRGRHRDPTLPPAMQTEAPKEPTIAEMVAPVSRPRARYYPAQGRTTAYGRAPLLPQAPGETREQFLKRQADHIASLAQREKRVREARRARQPGGKPVLERKTPAAPAPTPQGKRPPPRGVEETPPSVAVTTETPLTDETRPTAETRQATPGTPTFRTKVEETIEPKSPVVQGMPGRAEQRRRKERRRRKGVGAKKKRKWSATKTYKEIGKAAGAAAEPIEVDRLDTTAQELARAMTEEDIAREQARVEAVLREGRRPRRERPRYRYRVRGMGRTENRGR